MPRKPPVDPRPPKSTRASVSFPPEVSEELEKLAAAKKVSGFYPVSTDGLIKA